MEYRSEMGRCAISDWRKTLPVGSPRAFLDTNLKRMAKKADWVYPDIEGLHGNHLKGISELRWKCCGVPHRILGYTLRLPTIDTEGSISQGVFVMLIGCTHDKKKYDPTDALNTAAERRKNIEQGKASTSEYQLQFDK